MNKLYLRMAVSGIRKNKNTFVPFAITCAAMTMMFYLILAMRDNITVGAFYGATSTKQFLKFGQVIVAVMACIILMYTNGFLMKHRAKEFGIYNILGLEKKHLRLIVCWEILGVGVIGTLVGLFFGMLVGRLLFLLLLYILHVPVGIPYHIDWQGAGITAMFFGAIYLFLVLINSVRIALLKPVDMLRENKAGEREPKLKLVTTILGLACLVAGYVMAQQVQSAIKAVVEFFLAVILVIIGTYLLFVSGSIALLKLLKKNKRFYYHKRHFITVSGMMYRMKQNALGLATICILSTMVLVTVSTTVAMYAGIEDQVRNSCPYDLMLETTVWEEGDTDRMQAVKTETDRLLNEYQVKKSTEYVYSSFNVTGIVTEDEIGNWYVEDSHIADIYGYTFDEACKVANKDSVLAKLSVPEQNVVYLLCEDETVSKLVAGYLEKRQYQVETLKHSADGLGQQFVRVYNMEPVVLLTKDMDALMELAATMPRITNSGDPMPNTVECNYVFNLSGSRENKLAFSKAVIDGLDTWLGGSAVGYGYNAYYTNYEELFALDGTMLYIGCFLGLLFLLTTVLIIYYKQISEGYDDRNRFLIMENVGMSRKEVRKVIRSQILTVFALPILVAILHIVFAFHMIKLILQVLELTNVSLFIGCTVSTACAFVVIYVAVYMLTAKAYYRIVNTA